MAHLGPYETVQELSRSGLVTVFAARMAAGGGGEKAAFVAKVCAPDPAVLGEEAAAVVERFLKQAETARKIAGAVTTDRWVKVHQAGRTEMEGRDAGYVVTDLATVGSAERLAVGKVQLSSPVLSRLVGEVVRGLSDLEKALGRGHGNLKPSNVLISGERDAEITGLKVRLDDPVADGLADPERDRLADLRGVGELVHLLVLHQKFRGGWPVEASPAWRELGRDGDKWRELVNRLLDPNDKAERPGLDELNTLVSGLKTVKRSRRPLVIGAIAAALLLGGGTTAYFALRGPAKPEIVITLWNEKREQDWKELCTAYRGWYSVFQAGLNRPPPPAQGQYPTRRAAYAAMDPQLAALVNMQGAGEGFDPWSIAQGSEKGVKPDRDLTDLARTPGDYARSDWGVARTEQALGAIEKLRAGLEGWEAPTKLKARAEQWRGLGWTRAAAYLDEVAGAVSPERSPELSTAIDAVLLTTPAAEKVERQWAQIQADIGELKRAKDPVLDKFGPAAAGLIGSELGAGGGAGSGGSRSDLDALAARVQAVAELSARLAAFVKTDLATVDAESFTTAPGYIALTSALATSTTFEEWLKEARKWPSLTEPDPRMALDFDALSEAIRAQEKRLTSPPLNEKVDAATAARLAKLRPDWEAIDRAKVGWNRKNQQRVENETARVKRELEEVKVALEGSIERRMTAIREGAAAARRTLTGKMQVVPDSAAINATWAVWRDAIIAAHTDELYEEMVAKAKAVEDALTAVRNERFGGELPKPEGGAAVPAWAAQLNSAVGAERERRIDALMKSLGATPPADMKGEAFTSAASAAAQGFTQWLARVTQMRTDLAKLEDLLGQGIAPGAGSEEGVAAEQIWTKWSADDIAKQPEIAPALSGLNTRITAAKALATESDVGKLAATVRDAGADRPELVIGAWNRLADPAVGWPVSTAQLGDAKALRDKLDAVGKTLPEARRDALSRRVASDLAARWRAFAGGVKDVAAMRAALGAMADFGVTESDLDPRMRYNLLVQRFKAATQNASMEDDAVKQVAAQFTRDVQGLDGGVASEAKVSTLLSTLAPIATGDIPKEKPVDPLTLGPGKVWGPQSGQYTGETLTFQKGANRLEFVRVDVPSGDPVFICTREMSIGDFAEAAAGNPAIAASLAVADDWKGPRGWVRSGANGFRPGNWIIADAMFSATKPAYAPSIVAPGQSAQVSDAAGGEPTVDHPIQSVSPIAMGIAARALGCRFPTEAEWKAAYQKFGGGAGANLRDATFDTQKRHVAAMRPGVVRQDAFQWPDAATFGADVVPAPKMGESAADGSGNDGILWFVKTTAGAGPVHHLAGNVAEIVCADGPTMERAPATTAGVTAALGTEVGAIGGSALSDPGLGVDKVYPMDVEFAAEGYSDLGCRLAFNAKGVAPPRETFVARVGKMLTDEVYLLGR